MFKIPIMLIMVLLWSQSIWAQPSKEEVVSQSLDCWGSSMEHKKSTVDWNDVCVMPDQNDWVEKRHAKQSAWALEGTLATGIRNDQLQWSISGTDGDPDILSELTWDKIRVFTVSAKGEIAYDNKWLLDYNGGYGWVVEGENQDSDYLTNGRTNEFSRSNNQADMGRVLDYSVALGFRQDVQSWYGSMLQDTTGKDKLFLDLLAGYSYHEQKFYMTEGNQTIPATGKFAGLKSHYKAMWKSPWVGAQLKSEADNLHSFLRMEYHFADYLGEANWNLRSDFMHPKSYEHTDDGRGFVFSGGVGYAIKPGWSIDVLGKYNLWTTKNGTDRTFFSDGTQATTGLKEVEWKSWGLSLGNTFRF